MGTRELINWDELSKATDELLCPELMFEGSCDFLRAWEVLWAINHSPAVKENRERSPIQACATCASMALELALKSLITLEKKEPVLSHSFARLFNQLSSHSRAAIASKVLLEDRPTSVEAVTDALKLCEGTFERWRYKHEHRELDFYQGRMMQVTRAVHEVTAQRLSEWRKQSHPIRTPRPRTLTARQAHDLVARAIERLRFEDEDLPRDVNERALSHRLAVHLEREVRKLDPRLLGESVAPKDLSVDCEYNRRGDEPKRLHELAARIKAAAGEIDPVADMRACTVYPDIIVHRRGPAGPNLIVIEVKRAEAPAEAIGWDQDKLALYRTELRYLHAFLVLFGQGTPKIIPQGLERRSAT